MSGPVPARPFQNFGRNQAKEYQDLLKKDPKKAAESSVRYTPQAKPMMADAFGYAEQDIKMFDKNNDGVLDEKEVLAVFNNNKETAATFLSVLDSNGDKKLDVVEMAAYLLFSDDSTNQMTMTIDAMADGGVLTKKQADDYRTQLAPVIRNAPSAADGEVTAKERAVADFAILSMPNIARELLGQFPDALELRKRYADFKAKDPDKK